MGIWKVVSWPPALEWWMGEGSGSPFHPAFGGRNAWDGLCFEVQVCVNMGHNGRRIGEAHGTLSCTSTMQNHYISLLPGQCTWECHFIAMGRIWLAWRRSLFIGSYAVSVLFYLKKMLKKRLKVDSNFITLMLMCHQVNSNLQQYFRVFSSYRVLRGGLPFASSGVTRRPSTFYAHREYEFNAYTVWSVKWIHQDLYTFCSIRKKSGCRLLWCSEDNSKLGHNELQINNM